MERPGCVKCNRELVPYHLNDSFYWCDGTPDEPHEPFLMTSKLIDSVEPKKIEKEINQKPQPPKEEKQMASC